ncbi:MAG: Veg family protein [Lachnospiraceae bacterium]|nr:Veg family protein [Lachnospiraceae bacterium]
MEQPTEMSRIVYNVKHSVGRRVKVCENKGRNKVDVMEGVISAIYPCVFTVKVTPENVPDAIEQTFSYSYTDVLTKDVELVYV